MSTHKRNVYLLLMVIILATIPCYCLALFTLSNRISGGNPTVMPIVSVTFTPTFSLTPIQATATWTLPTVTPFPTRTPTATLLPTPTQSFPTIVPSPTDIVVPPTATPIPSPTPIPPTPTPIPTATPLPIDPFATPTLAPFDDI